jgi:putative FmdB family regulatory protein
MPLYEYECAACTKRFEVIQKYADPHVESCRACGKGPVRRLMSSPAIQFKGSGFYITDYAQKSRTDAGRDSGKEAARSTTESAAKSDAPATSTSSGETAAKSDAPAAAATPAPTAKE